MLTKIKLIALFVAFTGVAYFFYDYGVSSTNIAAKKSQDELFAKLEVKQNEAYELAVDLANQKPIVEIEYRTIEKEVIKYAQANSDKQCVVNDDDWLRVRADAVRAHNRAIGFQQPATVSDDTTKTARSSSNAYERDAEVLAEDVANLKTCTENAQKLQSLQIWIKAQIPSHSDQ
ncbi:hypothetical protein [Vibrio scophthalmi]|uniref:Uncharacterized protein n=1 Tax=Vibrio scophthalmi TaxID=45658 RepID=A0A1C7FA38_9VIBR|nr:hypothetical protein [Vibrio scophthalmi]ANU36283.1 hypothetical protein VSVS05_01156 [Vibrio scophthalmi]